MLNEETPARSGLLTVILPAYNEEKMIALAADTLSGVLEGAGIRYELLFVNDGSRDGTWEAVCRAARSNSRVRGLCFSRNFGKESAMFAGLAHAAGDCVAVMDCDLQHPPETLVELYRRWQQGYDVVEGVKASRGRENPVHGLCARAFYGLISRATGMDMSRASDFKLLDRRVVQVLNSLPERGVFFRALAGYVGFSKCEVPFEVAERAQGQSKWSAWSLIKYAVANIAAFSAAPMQLVTGAGAVVLVLSLVLGVQTLYKKMAGLAVEGFTTVIIVQLFIGSVIMISLGIIGYYIAQIYREIKQRPRYIVAATCGKTQAETAGL